MSRRLVDEDDDDDDQEALHSVNNSARDLQSGLKSAASAPGLASVDAPLKPFLVLVAAFVAVLAVLGACSIYLGGCESAPQQCLAQSLAAAALGVAHQGNFSAAGVRVRAAPTPAFWANFSLEHQLLGAASLFALDNGNNASEAALDGAAPPPGGDEFVVRRSAFWLSASQSLGQFARVGMQCSCARAVRSTLGSALVALKASGDGAPSPSLSVFQNNSATPAAIVETALVRDKWDLPATTALLALPTAAFADANRTLLFLDLATQSKGDDEPQFNRSVIAVGQLQGPPFLIANLTSSFQLRPSVALQRPADAALYFAVRRPDASANCTTHCFTVARAPSVDSVLSDEPQVEYLAAVDANHAATWTADASKAAPPAGFDCQLTSVFKQWALCLGSTAQNATNAVHLVQLNELWSGSVVASGLLTTTDNSTFLSAAFHPETLVSSAALSTIGVTAVTSDGSSSPLQTFWLLDVQAKI
jgi:hypothetical protein